MPVPVELDRPQGDGRGLAMADSAAARGRNVSPGDCSTCWALPALVRGVASTRLIKAWMLRSCSSRVGVVHLPNVQ